MRHMVFDLESLAASTYNGLLLQIGAVAFDEGDLELGGYAEEDQFQVNINMKDALKHGMEVDAQTLQFWLFQPEEARRAVFKGEKRDLVPALEMYTKWFRNQEKKAGGPKNLEVWSHADFDPPLLRNAYKKIGRSCPISGDNGDGGHRMVRDLRTFLRRVWGEEPIPKVEFNGIKHTGLSDSWLEADILKLTLAREHKMKEAFERYRAEENDSSMGVSP